MFRPSVKSATATIPTLSNPSAPVHPPHADTEHSTRGVQVLKVKNPELKQTVCAPHVFQLFPPLPLSEVREDAANKVITSCPAVPEARRTGSGRDPAACTAARTTPTFLAHAWFRLSGPASSCCDRIRTSVVPVNWPGSCLDCAHALA